MDGWGENLSYNKKYNNIHHEKILAQRRLRDRKHYQEHLEEINHKQQQKRLGIKLSAGC
jgi:hypothetical protein